jgi:site-specific DNA-adenine methylase
METKIRNFFDTLKVKKFFFSNLNFKDLDIDKFTSKTFVYADPPYLLSCATYNESNGWGKKQEKELLQFLDKLDSRGIKFALSNVLESKGFENTILKDWLEKNKYKVTYLDFNYSNSNYQIKNRTLVDKEVLICNY